MTCTLSWYDLGQWRSPVVHKIIPIYIFFSFFFFRDFVRHSKPGINFFTNGRKHTTRPTIPSHLPATLASSSMISSPHHQTASWQDVRLRRPQPINFTSAINRSSTPPTACGSSFMTASLHPQTANHKNVRARRPPPIGSSSIINLPATTPTILSHAPTFRGYSSMTSNLHHQTASRINGRARRPPPIGSTIIIN